MAGFFYRDLAEASAIKEKLDPYCEFSKAVKELDPFATPKSGLNTLPDVEDIQKEK